MTDYTQMTDEELATALTDAQAAQDEGARRGRLYEAPRQIAQLLFQVEQDGGSQVDAVLRGLSTSMRDLDPFGSAEGYDDPVIDNDEAAEIIASLQARIDAV